MESSLVRHYITSKLTVLLRLTDYGLAISKVEEISVVSTLRQWIESLAGTEFNVVIVNGEVVYTTGKKKQE